MLAKRLNNIDEAAVYSRRSKCAVHEMLWAGRMSHVKEGRRILIDILDMNRWIEQSKTCITYLMILAY